MANTSRSLTKILAFGLLTTQVAAHGYVQGIVADGTYYQGYHPSFQWLSDPPQVAGWSDPANNDNGPVHNYTSPDIICHKSATPGQAYATVQAGDNVTLQWTPWPTGHLGPVLTYLANCNGDCTTVDKNNLLFTKIDEKGLIQGGSSPGVWAANELITNNNSWTLTIPSSIAPGNYVLRNEIISLQEAMAIGGAQNYPQCVNIKVTGSGTNNLQTGGTKATQFYSLQDPGLFIDIYQSLSNYTIPGPPLLVGAGNGTQPVPFPTAPFTNATTTFVVSTTPVFPTTTTTTTLATSTTTSALSFTSPSALNFVTVPTSTTTPPALDFVTVPTSTTTPSALSLAVISTVTTTTTVTAPTTFQTSTLSSSSSSNTVQTSVFVGGYGAATVTVTITESRDGILVGANTTFARPTGTGCPIINGTGTYPFNGTARPTGTGYPIIHGTGAYPFHRTSHPTGTFTWTRSSATAGVDVYSETINYLPATVLASETPAPTVGGFIGVDHGFRAKQRGRRFLREKY